MNNDTISRSALLEEFEWLRMTVGSGSVSDIDDAAERIKKAPAVDAEPVRHDGCALCNIKETGHGVIAFYGIGWQLCINKRGKNYYLVMGHDGSQTEMLIGYCPACGAKMNAEVSE